jgi:hypothetical protein
MSHYLTRGGASGCGACNSVSDYGDGYGKDAPKKGGGETLVLLGLLSATVIGLWVYLKATDTPADKAYRKKMGY